MPRKFVRVRFGILSQLDLRPLRGQTLYDRGGSSVVMPAFGEVGQGLYNDAMVFLNGRGALSARTFEAQLNAIWNAATGATPNATVNIDSDDKIRIEADLTFAINATAGNATFGVNTSGQTASFDGSRWVLIAEGDWLRGPVGDVMVFSVPSSAIIVPASGYIAQDIPALINTGSGGQGGQTLEQLESAAGYEVWWHIDEEGHAKWASAANIPITWTSTNFRNLLGFTGDESLSFDGITYSKGAGVLAQKIRRIALENDIPVVEKKDLAQFLYKNVEVNHPIPPEQYQAVAEILRYVYELKGKELPTMKQAG